MVLLGGSIAVAQMGDSNASIPTPQPVYTRSMFASLGRSVEQSAVTFVSAAAQSENIGGRLGLAKTTLAVNSTRTISKADMVHNDHCPVIEVNPETYEVRADGVLLTCEASERTTNGATLLSFLTRSGMSENLKVASKFARADSIESVGAHVITLDYEARFLRRKRLLSDTGEPFWLILPKPYLLNTVTFLFAMMVQK